VTESRFPAALQTLYAARDSQDDQLVATAGDALLHGYNSGLAVGAVFLLAAALVTAIAVNAPRQPGSGAIAPH
jgi:hypothetical protein